MTQDALKETLAELKQQLSAAPGGSITLTSEDEQGARIQQLTQMVEQLLEHPDRDAEIDTLLAEVRDQTRQFIARHPHLDAVLRQLMSLLGNLGI